LILTGLAAIVLVGGFAVVVLTRRRRVLARTRQQQQLDELWHASGAGVVDEPTVKAPEPTVDDDFSAEVQEDELAGLTTR